MRKSYNIQRPMNLQRPPQMTPAQMAIFLENQRKKRKEKSDQDPPEPPATAFFLCEPPKQSNTNYTVIADGVIDTNKIIMA